MKKIILWIIGVIFLGIFTGWFFIMNANREVEIPKDDSSIIFFYGKLCAYCGSVEKYFDENNVSENINFSKREVYFNRGNKALMIEKSLECGLDEKDLGVPMIFSNGECIFGEKKIKDFFNEKMSEKQKEVVEPFYN